MYFSLIKKKLIVCFVPVLKIFPLFQIHDHDMNDGNRLMLCHFLEGL